MSVINGVYDPLGLAAPVILSDKRLLREAMNGPLEWDQPLPNEFRIRFEKWKDLLNELANFQELQMYTREIKHRNFLVFSDASEKAVAVVVYLQLFDSNRQQDISFVLRNVNLHLKTKTQFHVWNYIQRFLPP